MPRSLVLRCWCAVVLLLLISGAAVDAFTPRGRFAAPHNQRVKVVTNSTLRAAADGTTTILGAAHTVADSIRDNDPLSTDCLTDHSSTVWMCISTVLVLGMSPALALFEAGMLRSKSTVSLITQIFSGVITLSVLWVCIGYTLTFGESQGQMIGNLAHVFMRDVSYSECSEFAEYKIPEALFATFQMMFAVITPLLMTGSFAERMRFKSFMLLIVLWQIFVYYPLAHWIWGGGFLGKWGVLDFAGGIVIHTSAGIGSLVSAMYLGRRKHFMEFMGEMPPSNLPLAATGAALLWIGWFGFNGGSALASGPVAVSAIVSTQIGCSMGSFTWLVLSWWKDKPSAVALMNGALAGLAGITPTSGYVDTPTTIVLGFLFGISSFYSVHLLKHRWHIDDALDVSSVHGLTGIVGALAIGFVAQKSIDPAGANGAFYGHAMQLLYQFVGVVFTIVYAGVWTYVLLRFVDKVHGGMRITDEEEEMGLDWSEHREVAYHKLHVLDDPQIEEGTHPQMGGQRRRQSDDSMHDHLLDSPVQTEVVNHSYGTSSHQSRAAERDRGISSILITAPAPGRPLTPSLPSSHQYKRASISHNNDH